jgi:glycerophosphoryl diester phosphodiesterase
VRHRFLEGLKPTLHISHRGGSKLAPENTMAAFRQAVEVYRTDMIELDVHATRDGELVVAHDATVDRCTDGSGGISSLTYSELQQLDAGCRFTPDGMHFPFQGRGVRIPRLLEVLRGFPQLRINVELKAAGFEKAFASLVRAEQAVDRICCGSESDAIAAKLHDALPEACHFFPRDALTAFILAVKAGEQPFDDERYAVLDMPLWFQGMRLFDEALRDAALRMGRWINLWTIDDPEEMRSLIAEGAGGIMTDRPDLLRAELNR